MGLRTALSLTSAVVQIVDFGGKLLTLTTEIYRSTKGKLAETSHLESITTDLAAVNGRPESAGRSVHGGPLVSRSTSSSWVKICQLLVQHRADHSDICDESDPMWAIYGDDGMSRLHVLEILREKNILARDIADRVRSCCRYIPALARRKDRPCRYRSIVWPPGFVCLCQSDTVRRDLK